MNPAKRIKEIRQLRGLSRAELASRLGTSRIRVWRIEEGVTSLSADDAAEFAAELGVSVASLYRKRRAA